MDILTARAPWFIAGPLIGGLVVLLRWIANQPFGALGGYIELTESARGRRLGPGWRAFFTVGIIAGGLASALIASGIHTTFAYGSALKGAVLTTAGLFMGLGGRLAGGCTSGHGICGTSLGSRASLVSTATFMATAIASAHVIAWFVGRAS